MVSTHARATPRAVLVGIAVGLVLPAALGQAQTYESISGQAHPCGWGDWADGAERTFSHSISYTIVVDDFRGYVVDCYTGTDAYFEFRGMLPGDVYVYAVWGQLGDYE